MREKVYVLLLDESDPNNKRVIVPRKRCNNEFDQQPQFCGGYPQFFGGTVKQGKKVLETLILEVQEESRKQYKLDKTAKLTLIYKGTVKGDNYEFYYTSDYQKDDNKPQPPENRDQGEMDQELFILECNSYQQFIKANDYDLLIDKLLEDVGTKGTPCCEENKEQFKGSETKEAFIEFFKKILQPGQTEGTLDQ